MIDLLEIVWPRLIGPTPTHAAIIIANENSDLRAIARQSWRRDTDAALEEARRLTDVEAQRRSTADTKAGTYLAVVGVLIPIIASIAPSLSDPKGDQALRMISAPLLILAVIYLATAGIWAFRVLRVSIEFRVDSADLVSIWSRPAPKAALVSQLLHAVYANRRPVNDKISRIKMTDAFLVRAFIAFALLLIVQAAWKPVSDAYAAVQFPVKSVLVAPKITKPKPAAISTSATSPLPSPATSAPYKTKQAPPAGTVNKSAGDKVSSSEPLKAK